MKLPTKRVIKVVIDNAVYKTCKTLKKARELIEKLMKQGHTDVGIVISEEDINPYIK